MKNRILATILCVGILLSFAGCGTDKPNSESLSANTEAITESSATTEQNTQQNDIEEKVDTPSSSVTGSSNDVQNHVPTFESAKPNTQSHPSDIYTEPTTSRPQNTPSIPKPSSASTETNTDKTNPHNQPTSVIAPSESKPKPTNSAEPDFDINYWVNYAKAYAQSVGLRLDSSAVDCWDNPISANAKCKYLEQDIQNRLNRYARDADITDVWIWAEKVSDNSYEIYIGYA